MKVLYFGSNGRQGSPAHVSELLLVDEELVAHYAPHLLVSGIGDGLLKRDELNTFRDELFK